MTPLPTRTTTYRLRSYTKDLSGLVQEETELPATLQPGQVLVRMHAVSLNARDLQIAMGTYPAPVAFPNGLVPVSDGAGEVLAVGEAVETCKVGDRVVTHLCAEWNHGEIGPRMQTTALGGGKDGVLAKVAVLDQFNLLPIPAHLSYDQASTLPIAALTAYHCLFGFTSTLQPGQSVLIEGTGGVSIAALQLALSAGARPIVISSSDEKLRRCAQLGVAEGDLINYRTVPDWHKRIPELSGGGVHHTIEIGGKETLVKAILSTRPFGNVWVVGYMDDYKTPAPATDSEGQALLDTAKAVLYTQARVQGVMCGSYQLFQQLIEAHVAAQTKVDTGLATRNYLVPVVDKVFDFADAKAAFQQLATGTFFGKVVIRIQ
ncbi:hypothetical protein ACQY0O_006342 [Thecaphora frezii]